jgi:hypothetical protein
MPRPQHAAEGWQLPAIIAEHPSGATSDSPDSRAPAAVCRRRAAASADPGTICRRVRHRPCQARCDGLPRRAVVSARRVRCRAVIRSRAAPKNAERSPLLQRSRPTIKYKFQICDRIVRGPVFFLPFRSREFE